MPHDGQRGGPLATPPPGARLFVTVELLLIDRESNGCDSQVLKANKHSISIKF
jgi:hypothetical protein